MKNYIQKFSGADVSMPARASWKAIILAWLGGVTAIGAVGLFAQTTGVPLMLGSFGATCVLVFGFPESPFSQPRNVLLGHTLASLIGLTFLWLFGPVWWAMGLAAGTTIAVMMLTRTVHPPAGSNPIIVFLAQPSWNFLLFPTALGAILLIAIALVYNNSVRNERYPRYW
jgi:CBS-domain-containing membrane protein